MDKIDIEVITQQKVETDIDTDNIFVDPNNFIFKISDLIKVKEEKRNRLYQICRTYYIDCINLIKIKNKMGKTDIIYKIPVLKLNEPDYNCNDCIDFINDKMERNGFHTLKVNNFTLFISWKYLEVHLESAKSK
jgi:hypothetical protein